ncbi:MAG: hypothetical protein ABSE21_21020 [Bryobacteraceae bacterium]|jgi:hypothetical protein
MLLIAFWAFSRDGSSQEGSSRHNSTMLRPDTFGAGWTAESLANLEIGMRPGRCVSYRFRADHDGSAAAVRVYFIFRKICSTGCYAAGDGGIIRVEIRADDGTAYHLPSRTTLASALVSDPLAQWNRLVHFQNAARLEAGMLYHIVFTNVSQDESTNFVSIDDLYTATDGLETQPAACRTDLAVLLRADGAAAWQTRPHHLPIFSLDYVDGFRQGQTYIDVKQSGVVISPGNSVREVFTVQAATPLFALAGVRVKPLASGGTLRIMLAEHSGKTIESATVSPAVPLGQSTWISLHFSSLRALTKGITYDLVLVSEEGSQYLVQPLQNGAQYGFEDESPFTGNHCEVNAGQGWKGCLNRSDLDVPFFFRASDRQP